MTILYKFLSIQPKYLIEYESLKVKNEPLGPLDSSWDTLFVILQRLFVLSFVLKNKLIKYSYSLRQNNVQATFFVWHATKHEICLLLLLSSH
jgi:hypothetical protein